MITFGLIIFQAITPPANADNQGPPPAASVLAASAITASIQGQETVATHGGMFSF